MANTFVFLRYSLCTSHEGIQGRSGVYSAIHTSPVS